MVINFIECEKLDWILFNEQREKKSGHGSTNYFDPNVILERSTIFQKASISGEGAEREIKTKTYTPGIYRIRKK